MNNNIFNIIFQYFNNNKTNDLFYNIYECQINNNINSFIYCYFIQ